MKLLPHAVPRKVPDDAVPQRNDVGLDGMSDISDRPAREGRGDGPVQRRLRHVKKLPTLRAAVKYKLFFNIQLGFA